MFLLLPDYTRNPRGGYRRYDASVLSQTPALRGSNPDLLRCSLSEWMPPLSKSGPTDATKLRNLVFRLREVKDCRATALFNSVDLADCFVLESGFLQSVAFLESRSWRNFR